jgi:cysteine-rich repeat protein
VLSETTVNLTDCVVTRNFGAYGGGILNTFGTVNIDRCTISDNTCTGVGGGILSLSGDSLVVVMNSTISRNRAFSGAGIFTYPLYGGFTLITLGVINSTISGNVATQSGGGIDAFEEGGVLLANATITANSAGNTGGGVVSSFCTISNTIIAGNSAGTAEPDCNAALTSDGYNLIENLEHCFISGDLTGVVTGVSARLGALRNNGGPTLTHAPLAGSPVLGAGSPAAPGSGGGACAADDQRGVARPIGATCDLGAVEWGCGDHVVELGEECDDGNAVDGDGCDSNCTTTRCGNDVVTAGEQCDDGNTASGDCCSPLCQLESAGSSCSDDSFCSTGDQCDGAGHCTGTPIACAAIDECHVEGDCNPGTGTCTNPAKLDGATCEDGDPCTTPDRCQAGVCTTGPICGGTMCLACTPGVGCAPDDPPACRTASSSLVTITDVSAGRGAPRASWLWKGPTSLADFGDPTVSSSYELCVLDRSGGTATLREHEAFPSGSASWAPSGHGFMFHLSTPSTRNAQTLRLRASGSGKGNIRLKDRSGDITVGGTPYAEDPDVTLRLRNSDGMCWNAHYPTSRLNDGMQFKASAR